MDYTDKNRTIYQEKQIGKIFYRVTNIYIGKIELHKAFEGLFVNKILRDERL